MDHINFIHQFAETNGTRPGIISMTISAISAIIAFISYIKDIQTIAALIASIVAIVSGGFAIYYYCLQIQKLKRND
jgi:hypothetical protein